MVEPFYIRQTAEPDALSDPQAWFRVCTEEAKAAGGKHARYSTHDDPPALLMEAWDVEFGELGPDGEGDQRWSLE